MRGPKYPGALLRIIIQQVLFSFVDADNLSQKTQKGLAGTTSSQTKGTRTRKVSSALKRPITTQLSNSSDHSSSSTSTLSVPRRKISVTETPLTRELITSHRLRKTSSQSSLQLSPKTSINRSSRSAEMINLATTHPDGSSSLNEPFSPSLRKLSAESTNHATSPLFIRRKISQSQPARRSPSPRMTRKISCPSQMQHLPRVHQEEIKPLQLSRDSSGNTSRSAVARTTDLPKLDVSRVTEQEPLFEGSVSPLGFHVDGMECTLQEKVNNFLRSLEKVDDSHAKEEKTSV